MVTQPSFKETSDWEKDWWGNCANTLGEEIKQLIYAQKMGLGWYHNGKSPHNINVHGKRILDIGGGPVSMLLKCENLGPTSVVADPCKYPKWVAARYAEAEIIYLQTKGEELDKVIDSTFDEVWIYNVLQHVDKPQKIIQNARKLGSLVRIFEWVDQGVTPGHPHNLLSENLNRWLEGEGRIEMLDLPTLKGKAYYGIFPGN